MIKEINGIKAHLREDVEDDYVYNEIFNKGVYVHFPLSSEDVVLDIGGNIGLFALYAYNKVKEIVSLEPEISNCDMYEKNISENNITNCKLIRCAAIGNDDKERFLYLRKDNNSTFSMYVKGGRERVSINCMNINDVLKLNKFNKIKIDIEGAEYEVIKGIKSFDGIESIIVEYHFNILKDLTLDKYMEVLNILKKNFKYVVKLDTPVYYMTTIVILATNEQVSK